MSRVPRRKRPRREIVHPAETATLVVGYSDAPGARFGRPCERGDGRMRVGWGFRRRRTRVALGVGAVLAGVIVGPSTIHPAAQAQPPAPFDANGLDNSFAVAQSRPQGPLIKGPTT